MKNRFRPAVLFFARVLPTLSSFPRRLRRANFLALSAALLLLLAPALEAQASGTKKRRPLPHEFGRVVMQTPSADRTVAPAVFEHWLHRSEFTCRLCHVDLGFAMQPNGTAVKEADNRSGFYCGACHDGKRAFGAQGTSEIRGRQVANCDRCHSQGKDVPLAREFAALTAGFARGRFGNGVDWMETETAGKLKLIDTLPGVSVQRKAMETPANYDIRTKVQGLPDIIFSHEKHAVWHGCELCHPDLFGVVRGGTKYTMQDIFAGRYCGACHDSVAFPTIDCQRCHAKPVPLGRP